MNFLSQRVYSITLFVITSLIVYSMALLLLSQAKQPILWKNLPDEAHATLGILTSS